LKQNVFTFIFKLPFLARKLQNFSQKRRLQNQSQLLAVTNVKHHDGNKNFYTKIPWKAQLQTDDSFPMPSYLAA